MDKVLPQRQGATRSTIFRSLLASVLLTIVVVTSLGLSIEHTSFARTKVPINAAHIVQQCRALHILPGPPKNFHQRSESDRFVSGTPPTLIRNATIWTGRVSGHEVLIGDVLVDKGIIQDVGKIKESVLKAYKDLAIVDAGGAWVTPGIVDIHSHLGVDSAPELKGASDTNSLKGLVLPWLRSLDGLNTHDDAYRLSISGGVTTANVLPGSADAIGGQAFTIKLRPTKERSSSAMVIEPPYTLNGTFVDPSLPPRWRQMKHACGENPSRVYSGTRMDTIWAFRQGYDKAREVKATQDTYCAKALRGEWNGLGDFPENLQWEALVDVLRGRVKIHNHCYEAVDLDGIVRLTNEFKFSIAAFHHAHETYLVPDLLKKAYGTTPAVALFATNARYKREAYRGSEYAPRILAENGLKVILKSDHPVLNSRHLLYEAQQAHYYGLPANLAIASVTSTPATVLGYDHRIGFLKPGYDADVVVWDSHPLALGAAPKQVFIDGIAQLEDPHVSKKPEQFQHAPKTPDFSKEIKETLKYDGLPPLEAKKANTDVVIFKNVDSVFLKKGSVIEEAFSVAEGGSSGVVIVERGKIVCMGTSPCSNFPDDRNVHTIDLEGGSISPSLISYGSHLGLHHIDGESTTNDGKVYNPLKGDPPSVLGVGPVIRAVDGLQFATRDALLGYRSGATVGVTAPSSSGFLAGLSTAFNTGSPHKLASSAVLQDDVALHISIDSSSPSVSTHIAALRNLLKGGEEGALGELFKQVFEGTLPLVINVQSADIMATLINLKKEIEELSGTDLQFVFEGANEAHLLAKEIGEAGVGVILNPSRPFPGTWKSRRILPGPPLTQQNAVAALIAHNVTVGIGIEEQWSSRNIRFDIAWAALEANGALSKSDAIALASVNLERLLGFRRSVTDLVATKGGSLFDFEGKVVSVISPERGVVDLI
ncbi:carbohydrate esterase family 9 protein [Pholiota conissans]|uniref:Carbohydrate esterase family 9 protein n=1 Tax=Pholiota conissans TaxID=109636 RepID=A0A9P5YRY2_9AGAR|nr:carbohydrate esterase family 9 protein [Pholiota conissans]